MAQLTIYLDDATERILRRETKAAKLSASRFVARLIQDHARSTLSPKVLAALGTWGDDDYPDAAELRKSLGKDARREKL
jgi:hypothetical protein